MPYIADSVTDQVMTYTIDQAAGQLGISPNAVRLRIRRGTLKSVRKGGRRLVVLPDSPTQSPTDQPTQSPTQGATVPREQYEAVTESLRGQIALLQGHIASLEQQLTRQHEITRASMVQVEMMAQRLKALPRTVQGQGYIYTEHVRPTA